MSYWQKVQPVLSTSTITKMYLIARPFTQAQKLISLLNSSNIAAKHLSIIEVVCNYPDLYDVVDLIHKFNSIMFVSPTAIDFCADLIKQRSLFVDKRILTAGRATAQNILQLNNELQVVYPHSDSGVKAMIEQGLLCNIDEMLVIGGDTINQQLIQYFEIHEIKYKLVHLYNRINMLKSCLDDILAQLTAPEVEGIVITSKSVALILRKIIEDYKLSTLLKNVNIISIHQQITLELEKLSLNIFQTETSDNHAILDLIKRLNHGR